MMLEMIYGLLTLVVLLTLLPIPLVLHYKGEFKKLKEYAYKVELDRLQTYNILEAAEELANHRKIVNDKIIDIVTSHPDVQKPVKVAVISVSK